MNLDEQLKSLIDEAPQHGVPSTVMEQAVTPVLKGFAQKLKHPEYYVSQNLAGNWVLTTLQSRVQPTREKKVIYAFANLKDAANFQGSVDPQMMATTVPVTSLLFQLFALQQVDSLIFLEIPGDLNTGIEIKRLDLQTALQKQLQQISPSRQRGNIPPNLAWQI